MSLFDIAIITVLKHEGGYVNDPSDPGGATNFGISLRWLKTIGDLDGDGWLDGDLDHNGEVDVADIQLMDEGQAARLYYEYFWAPYDYRLINSQAGATKIFDLAVNMGTRQSHKLAQRAARSQGFLIQDDGILGPISIKTINQCDPECYVAALRSEAAGFYRGLIAVKPKREKYEAGWLNRAYA